MRGWLWVMTAAVTEIIRLNRSAHLTFIAVFQQCVRGCTVCDRSSTLTINECSPTKPEKPAPMLVTLNMMLHVMATPHLCRIYEDARLAISVARHRSCVERNPPANALAAHR